MPPSRSPPRSVEKLRSSCDGCGFAKRKCDRGQPGCRRCADLGLACVYGPSHKLGKPRRKRPGQTSNLVSADIGKRVHVAPSADLDSATRNTSESWPAGFLGAVADTGAGPGQAACEQTAFYPFLSLQDWQLDLMEASPGTQAFGTGTLTMAPTTSESPDSSSTHSCRRESYEIFRDLICPGPFLHAPESNSVTVPARLDHVLHLNRTATDRLGRLLKCPCAKSGHRAMVHASIVSRILIWYQQAAASTAADTDSTTSVPSQTRATGFTVEYVPLSMGTFSVDDPKLQATLTRQLVLSELNKTAGLIDMFMSQEPAEASAGGVANLYSHLGEWLRGEHARTVESCRGGSRGDALDGS